MRLAILSDIHGNLKALEAVLADLKEQGAVDKTWVLGDLVIFGPHPAECVQLVKAIPNVEIIGGNTDRYMVTGNIPMPNTPKDETAYKVWPMQLQSRAASFGWTLSQLTFKDYEFISGIINRNLELKVDGYGWVVGYHGSPGNDNYLMFPDTPEEEVVDQFMDTGARLGFGGHTHLPMDREFANLRVVNVGSVGFPSDEPRASYVIAEINGDQANIDFHRVEYDTGSLIADLHTQEHPDAQWIIEKFINGWK